MSGALENSVELWPMTLVTIFLGLGVIIFALFFKWIKQEKPNVGSKKHDKPEKLKPSTAESSSKHSKKEQASSVKSSSKKKLADRENRRTARATDKAYPTWSIGSLKGHTGRVLDMDAAPNGKFLASCGEDRTIFIWDIKDITQKDRKSLRINVDFDYVTHVKWSPDSKAVIAHRFNDNCIEVYKVEKKKDGWITATKALTFPKAHETDIVGMGIASNGKFIMTCSNKTDMVIWDLKGEKLATLDTFLMSTTCAKISPCGRFVVASGFTPEAKTWEVVFNKTGEFKEVKPVTQLTLSGHSSGVYDVAFDVDSSHMATVSKDGTWKLFDTNVNYKQGQDARLEKTGKYELAGNYALIVLSPNSEVIVIATATDLQFFSTFTGELDYTFENICEEPITSIFFDASGKYLLATADKQIRIFHNVTGYRTSITTAKEKLKEHQTSATKDRLQKIIKDSEAFLTNLGEAF